MVIATPKYAQAMLPIGSMEGMVTADGRELILTSKGLILEERVSSQENFPNDRRKGGEGRTC